MALRLEFRCDPTKDVVIILASGREKRPMQIAKDGKMPCFFCRGNEGLTPKATFQAPSGSKWLVRSFENAFPMLSPNLKFVRGFSIASPAFGEHEVIAECPDDSLFQNLKKSQLKLVWQAYVNRFQALLKRKGIKHVLLFKNHGRAGGASIAHEHSQIISLPFTPELMQREYRCFEKHKHGTGKCQYCQFLETEKIVLESRNFKAVAPSFARFSHEIWVVPKKHVHSMLELSPAQGLEMLELMQKIVETLSPLSPDYNFIHHNGFCKANELCKDFHYHVEFIPRTSIWAGVELGDSVPVRTQSEEDTLRLFQSKT